MPFTLQQLSDVEDIKQLKHRYFRSIDTGNEADLTSVFTEDVTIDYRGGGYRAKLQGRQNMVDFIGSAFNSDIVAQHHGHCPEISFTGPDSAEGTWYLEDRFIDPIRQEDTIGTAIYRDRYARTADGWKIAHSEYGLSALLGHGYTVDNRAQPEMATFGVFRRRVPPIAMQNRRLPLDHWDRAVVPSDFR